MERSGYMRLSVSLVILFVVLHAPAFCQAENSEKDKYTLLTMPFNERPVTLFKGQFRANAGYKLGVRTNSFDGSGSRIGLRENGSASVYHNYAIGLRYGINDYIEAGIETNYIKHGIRSGSVAYFSGSDVINVHTLHETTGLSDLMLNLAIQAPLKSRNLGFSIGSGLKIPTAKYRPDKPTHILTDIIDNDNYTINYHYNNRNGDGVPVLFITSIIKLTTGTFSVEATGAYSRPLKTGSSIRWSQSLLNRNFTYFKTDYEYLLSETADINTSLHFQASGWLDLYLRGNYHRSVNGWTEFYDNKYANNKETLFILEPGFEIQVSPSLRIEELAGIPVMGKNTDAPFYILTSLTFNIFPW